VNLSKPHNGIRIVCLDAWRGLAALMVVLVHVIGPALLGPYPQLRNKLLYRSVTFGNYGVQIFFVVSGLCVVQAALKSLERPAPVAGFLLARVRRIYPPYMIVSVLAVAMSGTAAYLVGKNILPGSSIAAERLFARPAIDYASSVFMLQRVFHVTPLLPVFWTLCYEVAFYGLVAATLLAAVGFRRRLLVLDLCHAITIASSIALLVSPDHVPFPLDLWPEFGLGVIALDILMLRRAAGLYVLASTLVLQGIYAWKHFNDGVEYKGSLGTAALVAMVFCLSLLAARRFDTAIAGWPPVRLLGYIGGFSYSLYLSHWLVIGVVSQLMKKIYAINADTYWISALVQVIAAVAVSRVFYTMAEQPFLQSRTLAPRSKMLFPRQLTSTLPRPRAGYAKAA
jgi:peptidoglycan/LPS O-acetylase OafA/YrhL